MAPVTKQELLQRAAELIGRDQLATRLGVPQGTLDAWMRGEVAMPDGKLLVLAAIMDKEAGKKR